MQTDNFDIVETNLSVFVKELENRILDGWAIDKTNPGEVVGVYGGVFTVALFRNNETVQRLHSRVSTVKEDPKPSRAEILAKARQVRADKKSTSKS